MPVSTMRCGTVVQWPADTRGPMRTLRSRFQRVGQWGWASSIRHIPYRSNRGRTGTVARGFRRATDVDAFGIMDTGNFGRLDCTASPVQGNTCCFAVSSQGWRSGNTNIRLIARYQ